MGSCFALRLFECGATSPSYQATFQCPGDGIRGLVLAAAMTPVMTRLCQVGCNVGNSESSDGPPGDVKDFPRSCWTVRIEGTGFGYRGERVPKKLEFFIDLCWGLNMCLLRFLIPIFPWWARQADQHVTEYSVAISIPFQFPRSRRFLSGSSLTPYSSAMSISRILSTISKSLSVQKTIYICFCLLRPFRGTVHRTAKLATSW